MPAVSADDRKTYSVLEFAKVAGVGKNTVYDDVKLGKIKSVRIGTKILIPRDWADRFLAGEVGPANATR